MPYLLMAIFVLVVGVGLTGVVVYAMAFRLLRPPRMNDGKALAILKRLSPNDIDLAYEPMNFTVQDAARPLRLAAWWMPAVAPSDSTAILVHGYADAKVGAIAWAPTWHALGWNVLAIDLRAHGDSGGRHSTGGYFERDDLSQVIDALRGAKPRAAVRIALFGVSLGAAVVCGAAARRDDIAAVVLDSPFDDFAAAASVWARRSSLPLPTLMPFAARLAERISGADFAAVAPVRLVSQIAAPLLVIFGEDDAFLNASQRAAMQTAISRRPATAVTELAVFAGAGHNLALASDPPRYRAILAAFLSAAGQSNRGGL